MAITCRRGSRQARAQPLPLRVHEPHRRLEEIVLRITPVATTNGSKRLKVEGRLAGPFVEELARAATGDRSGTVAIDLADVTFVDQRGVELLRSLRTDGVDLIDCSQFVQTLVNGGSR